MAEKNIKIRIDVDTDKGVKNVDNLKKEIGGISKGTDGAKAQLDGFGKSVSGLGGPIGSAISGIKALGKQLWILMTNPIVATIAAITAVFFGLYKLLRNFEPVFNAIEQATAAVSAVFNVLKNVVISVFTGASNLRDAFSGLGGKMKDAAEAAFKLKGELIELEHLQERSQVTNSKLKTQIDELMLQSKNRTLSEDERMAKIDEALKLEEQVHASKKAMADEARRIAEQDIAITNLLTEEELKNLQTLGIAYAQELEDRKGVSKEQMQALLDAELLQEEIARDSVMMQERAMNRRDVLEDKKAAKAEKAAEAEKERQAKAAEELDKQVEKLQKKADEMVDIGDKLHQELLDNQKAFDDKLSAQMDEDMAADYEKLKTQLDKEKALTDEINSWKFVTLAEFFDNKQALLDEAFAKQLISEADYNEKSKQLDRERLAAKMEQAAMMTEMGTAVLDNAAALLDTIAKNQQMADKKEMKALDKKQADRLKNFKGTEKQRAKLEEQMAKEKQQLEEKQLEEQKKIAKAAFIVKKVSSLASAAVNTASGVMGAIASTPGPAGIAMGVIVGLIGALQMATIAATKFDDSAFEAPAPSTSGMGSAGGGSSGGNGNQSGPNISFLPGQGNVPETPPLKTYVVSNDINTNEALDRAAQKNALRY